MNSTIQLYAITIVKNNRRLKVLSITNIDPVVVFRNSQMEIVRGTIISLQRKSLVMEVYNPYSIVQVSEVLNQLEIKTNTKKIYSGKAVVVSMVNTGLTALVSATFVDDWQELNDATITPQRLLEETKNFIREWEDKFQIRLRYQTLVNELRGFLSDTARWVSQIDMTESLPKEKIATGARLQADYFAELSQPIVQKVAKYLDDLEEEAMLVEKEQVAVHQAFAQAALHPFLLRAPFVFRAYSKPLGYAGDYEMVNQIISDPRQGQNTYFELVNAAFLQTPVAEAHRNRIQILVQFLEKHAKMAEQAGRPFRVLNVACGPAFEVQQFLQKSPLSKWLSFRLLDFSEEALNWTKQKITQELSAKHHHQVEYVQDSVHNLLKWQASQTQPTVKEFDVIYCAGLFDYLSDKVCKRLLEYFAARIVAGGSILVTNVHTDNPNKAFMEHILEWYLIYRDEISMQKLIPGNVKTYEIYRDVTGVNVFLEMKCN